MIHIIKETEQDDTTFFVWTDCQRGHRESGRVIGSGRTVKQALARAIRSLDADRRQLQNMRNCWPWVDARLEKRDWAPGWND
jgi:carbamoylphosphate synthase large subunit